MIQIEETVFARKRWIESKMLAYGFHKTNETYILEKPFLDGNFKAILSVTSKGLVTGKVIDRMTQAILDNFQVRPDFPWNHSARYQSYGAFRHSSNRKWFALIMNVKRGVLDKDGNSGQVDIINVKIRPEQAEQLHRIPGLYPAYHMNHKTWISVVLDETLPDERILEFIDTSYQLTIH